MANLKIAINGFGRIGRLCFRALLDKGLDNIEIVAINDLTDNTTLAHLLKYDTAHGKFNGTISSDADSLTVNGKRIHAYAERNPAALPWADLGIDVVLECTGRFCHIDDASKHLEGGAKKVLISAPGKGGVKTVVLGINDDSLTADDKVISNASCTTNCLGQMVKVLEENFGIKEGIFTTVHAYTSDQNIQDAPHKDLRRARAASQNIIPTTTGAAAAVVKIFPKLQGKLTGIAARVPVITGSFTDLSVNLEKTATAEEINAAFREAANNLEGILEYTDEPIVSSDIVSNSNSCIFDSGMTIVTGNMVKIVGWYDNEAGYANRLADLAVKMASFA